MIVSLQQVGGSVAPTSGVMVMIITPPIGAQIPPICGRLTTIHSDGACAPPMSGLMWSVCKYVMNEVGSPTFRMRLICDPAAASCH